MMVKIVRIFATFLLSVLLASPSSEAQQPKKMPRIGYLTVGSASGPGIEAFQQGLRELGYVEGQNIIIERRSVGGREDQLPDAAAELVGLKVDVIFAPNPPAARAAKDATSTIPIVMRSTGDPVRSGLVASLARPGGNITGFSSISHELTGKRLELLKEVVPGLSRVAVLWNPDRRQTSAHKEAEVAAKRLGVQIQSLELRDPNELESLFEKARRERAGGLITLRNPLIVHQRKRIAELALKSHLPGIYDEWEFVEAGGLMSYGTHLADLYRRAPTYVDKILKGAKPADLPVEQPTKFELVINLKTAKALGVKIPSHLLMEADKVIE